MSERGRNVTVLRGDVHGDLRQHGDAGRRATEQDVIVGALHFAPEVAALECVNILGRTHIDATLRVVGGGVEDGGQDGASQRTGGAASKRIKRLTGGENDLHRDYVGGDDGALAGGRILTNHDVGIVVAVVGERAIPGLQGRGGQRSARGGRLRRNHHIPRGYLFITGGAVGCHTQGRQAAAYQKCQGHHLTQACKTCLH